MIIQSSVYRRVRIIIDRQALRHNFSRVEEYAPHSRIMAVIKANGYGHGLLTVAQTLRQADMFAVATPAEALFLRNQGIEQALLVLHGFRYPEELKQLADKKIEPVIHQLWQLDMVERYTGIDINVWLKVDTGMHRLGIDPVDIEPAYERLKQCQAVASISLLSHFSNADEEDNSINNNQIELFSKVNNKSYRHASMANSAAIISLPESHFDIVRPGIMLYGSSPFMHRSAAQLDLRAVMNFESELIAIRSLKKGDCIGYGGKWVCPQAMQIGIVGAGYGDGYPRHAKSGTPVWLNGHRCDLLGRVSMDSLCINLHDIHAKVGDRVVLWGKELPVDDVAHGADTIAYELLCTAGSMIRSDESVCLV